MNLSYKTIERIYYVRDRPGSRGRHASFADDCIDKIAVYKGHRYETVITDTLTGKVHGMHANRDTSSMKELLGTLITSII